jgi:hypothetical protein
MGSENAHEWAQNAENASALTFLGRYHKDGDEFFDHILRVTGDETSISFVNVETKEQLEVCMPHMSKKKKKKGKM